MRRFATVALASLALSLSACDAAETDEGVASSEEQDLVGGKAESRFRAVGYLAAAGEDTPLYVGSVTQALTDGRKYLQYLNGYEATFGHVEFYEQGIEAGRLALLEPEG